MQNHFSPNHRSNSSPSANPTTLPQNPSRLPALPTHTPVPQPSPAGNFAGISSSPPNSSGNSFFNRFLSRAESMLCAWAANQDPDQPDLAELSKATLIFQRLHKMRQEQQAQLGASNTHQINPQPDSQPETLISCNQPPVSNTSSTPHGNPRPDKSLLSAKSPAIRQIPPTPEPSSLPGHGTPSPSPNKSAPSESLTNLNDLLKEARALAHVFSPKKKKKPHIHMKQAV